MMSYFQAKPADRKCKKQCRVLMEDPKNGIVCWGLDRITLCLFWQTMRKVGQANVSTPSLSLFPRQIPHNGICNSRQLPGNRALSFGYPNMVHFLPTNIYKPILWISLIWFLDAAICDWRKRWKESIRDYSGWQKPFQPALVEMFPVRSQLLVDQVLMLKSCFFF